MKIKLRGIYTGLCINCSGPISDERLLSIGLCKKCLDENSNVRSWVSARKVLAESGKLNEAKRIYDFLREKRDFLLFLRKL